MMIILHIYGSITGHCLLSHTLHYWELTLRCAADSIASDRTAHTTHLQGSSSCLQFPRRTCSDICWDRFALSQLACSTSNCSKGNVRRFLHSKFRSSYTTSSRKSNIGTYLTIQLINDQSKHTIYLISHLRYILMILSPIKKPHLTHSFPNSVFTHIIIHPNQIRIT